MLVWVDWRIMDAGEFSQLQKLEVINCPKLTGELPKKVPALVRLEIRGCPELVASLPRTTSIREIVLDRCQEVGLEWQCVSYVEKLQISGFSNLEEFPRELVTLRNLQVLSVVECPERLSFPEGMMRVNDLKRLNVWSCPKLVLPLSLEMSHCYTSLERLTLSGCWSLKSLPLDLFPKLSFLEIYDCKNFETLLIPDGIELQNLRMLSISRCNNMVSFPCRELPAPNMSLLRVWDCEKLKALPERMHTLLPSLWRLYLSNCPEIESFPEGGLPSKLNSISIRNCKKLAGGRRDWGLQTLPSLTDFSLGGESEDVVESFPEERLLPSTLTRLTIYNMPNLKSLNKRGLQLLCSLKCIEIWNCHQLQFLPEEGLPTSLIMLNIKNCPLLKSRYRREEGEEWRKIAHVPVINMDGEAFIDQVYLGPAGRHGFPNFMAVGYVSPPRLGDSDVEVIGYPEFS
ncbi:hypothetical protein Vadar_027413 [Vaccinium darrowii]|uniref:Uncharacterized protein n=1 Tax=Vaccinium darrowii TaxID=229202 RepID=A0ACB7Y2U9_9ERIC|nr:hypothetical protein Vadar_027413 [Vaccinium darrowii]